MAFLLKYKCAPIFGTLRALGVAVFITCAFFSNLCYAFTELGNSGPSNGDHFVSSRFQAFLQKNAGGGCIAHGAGHRIMVTGFGKVVHAGYNISGAIVSSMADSRFWPDIVNIEEVIKPQVDPQNGVISDNDLSARISVRSVVINQIPYEICYVVTDALWDFPAAVIVHEATQFKPELILMTGQTPRPYVEIETAALNHAGSLAGVDSHGELLASHWLHHLPNENQPKQPYILPNYPEGLSLSMNWQPAKIARSIDNQVKLNGYQAEPESTARSTNNYVCNNISFAVLNAARNRPTELAGGEIKLPSPDFSQQPIVGFMHLPATFKAHPDLHAYRDQISRWNSIIATVIISQIK